jgi:hypothetical protein
MSKLSTPAEIRIADKISSDNFPLGKFYKISSLLIRRQSRRHERIRLDNLCKTDIDQGFDRKNFPHITQFGKRIYN